MKLILAHDDTPQGHHQARPGKVQVEPVRNCYFNGDLVRWCTYVYISANSRPLSAFPLDLQNKMLIK